jgi:hypothetical protein
MTSILYRLAVASFFALSLFVPAMNAHAEDPWVVYPGGAGPGAGKNVVLVSGDEEYRSEEALPMLGKILSKHHGFTCTVLFAINKGTGEIDPVVLDNIPGLEALKKADVMIIATRFRNLPDDQMKLIDDFLAEGKPVIGLRTATHGFNGLKGPYAKWNHNAKVEGFDGGFGRLVHGETWINHHRSHAKESTRGVIAPGQEKHPIVQGCGDIWGPTDVYTVRLPLPGDCQPLVMGQVLEGMNPTDKPVVGKKNDPMMPVAWIKSYQVPGGKKGKAFTTTMGSANDFPSEGLRRLVVNACYWCAGLEEKIPAKSVVDLVGDYKPLNFGFGKFKKGVKPADLK